MSPATDSVLRVKIQKRLHEDDISPAVAACLSKPGSLDRDNNMNGCHLPRFRIVLRLCSTVLLADI
jgi:hypothetical protein